jgi:CRISPR system Cascade subunit CasA
MNLVSDKWISVVLASGESVRLSLLGFFSDLEKVQDLSLRPHERISLMRLFLCITHASLDGPKNRKEWKQCKEKISTAATKYLSNPSIQEAFELFGEGQRFLQVDDLLLASGDKVGQPSSKLDFALSSGNNATLFDQAAGSDRVFNDSTNALNLLTFQNFQTCGLVGVGLWGGSPTLGWSNYPKRGSGSSEHSPCIIGNMLHTFLRGKNLLETLHLNLVNKELVDEALGQDRWGKPVWEDPPQSPVDTSKIKNVIETYLGRLVPLSWAIRFTEDGASMLLANALDFPGYDKGYREATSSIVVKANSEERAPIRGSIEQAPWRQLHALTVKNFSFGNIGGPLALDNLDGDESFDIWTGALLASANAKIIDSLESVFNKVPSAMLNASGQKIYRGGVEFSREAAKRLGKAVYYYNKKIWDDNDRADRSKHRQAQSNKALLFFWTAGEQSLSLLFNIVQNPSELRVDADYSETSWGKAVNKIQRRAYESVCPRGTSRQLQAFAAGLKYLRKPKPKSVAA